jgi:hypothetical protein
VLFSNAFSLNEMFVEIKSYFVRELRGCRSPCSDFSHKVLRVTAGKAGTETCVPLFGS